MKIDREIIGERLRAYRKELNMTQEFVCDFNDIVQSQLSAIENGLGGGVELLCTLLAFYDKEFDLRNFFADSFEPLPKGKKLKEHWLTKSEALDKKLVEIKEMVDDVIDLNNKKLRSF